MRIAIILLAASAWAQQLPLGGIPISSGPSLPAVVGTPVTAIGGGFGANPVSAAATSHTAGNALAVFVTDITFGAGCPTWTVTNTAGDTFNPAGACFQNTGNDRAGRWYVATSTAGNASDVVTVSSTGAAFTNFWVFQISGLRASPVDQTATGETAAKSVTSGTFTTTYANEIILVGVFDSDGTLDYSTPSGYTAGPISKGKTYYKIVSSIQTGVSVTVSWTTVSQESIIYVLSLKGV